MPARHAPASGGIFWHSKTCERPRLADIDRLDCSSWFRLDGRGEEGLFWALSLIFSPRPNDAFVRIWKDGPRWSRWRAETELPTKLAEYAANRPHKPFTFRYRKHGHAVVML